MRKTTTVREPARLRRVHPSGWWFDGLLLVAAVALTVALANGVLLDLDLAVRDWAEPYRDQPVYQVARVFNYLGQGGWLLMPVAGALAVAVSLRARSVRPLLVVAAAFLLNYLTVGPIKLALHRAYPRTFALAHPEQLFGDPVEGLPYPMAYPSGHVVNTIVWYWAIALLLAALLRTADRNLPPRLHLALRAGPPAIVLVTTVFLNHHWLTDSVAGLLVGVLLERLLARVPWDDVPLPALPRGLERPGAFTSAP